MDIFDVGNLRCLPAGFTEAEVRLAAVAAALEVMIHAVEKLGLIKLDAQMYRNKF